MTVESLRFCSPDRSAAHISDQEISRLSIRDQNLSFFAFFGLLLLRNMSPISVCSRHFVLFIHVNGFKQLRIMPFMEFQFRLPASYRQPKKVCWTMDYIKYVSTGPARRSKSIHCLFTTVRSSRRHTQRVSNFFLELVAVEDPFSLAPYWIVFMEPMSSKLDRVSPDQQRVIPIKNSTGAILYFFLTPCE